MLLTIGAVALAIVFTLGSLGLGTVALLRVIASTNRESTAPTEAVEVRLAALEVTVQGLPSLWEEERKRAKRAQDSARKDREHSEQIRAELAEEVERVDEFSVPDGEGIEPERVQPMLRRLGGAPSEGLHERAQSVAHLMR